MSLIARSPESYRSTADEFLAHWTQANTTAGAHPILCKGGYTCAQFQTDRDLLEAKINSLRVALSHKQILSARRDNAKATLAQQLTRFKASVANALMGTLYAANLPLQPVKSSDEKTFLEPLFKMRERWREINAITTQVAGFIGPFVLGDGTTLAQFESEIAALQTIYRELDSSDAEIERTRRERDALLLPLKERMMQYRKGVLARFGQGHPLTASLPVLLATSSRALQPVRLSGQWDNESNTAVLTWNASTEATLDGYSVRTSPGASYKVSSEDTVVFLPAGTTTWSGTEGLETPGSVANFKVYLVLKGSRERGSNAVKVTRPSA